MFNVSVCIKLCSVSFILSIEKSCRRNVRAFYVHIYTRPQCMPAILIHAPFYSGFSRCHWTIVWRGLVIISCQCFVSDAPEPFLPAKRMRPISSLRPMLSKSITITSSEHSRIFSHGTLNENVSLKTGLRVHLKMAVLRFSIRLSPNCSHTFTYGSDFPLMSFALRLRALSRVSVRMLLLGW